jgi:sugar transferase (PEP-CTERM/EpsH1 system associated)
MRILHIIDQIPYPPISGAQLHNYNLLRRLSREHQVWVAAFVRTAEQARGVDHLQEFCQAVATANLSPSPALDRPVDFFRYLLTGKPPDLRFWSSEEMASKIRHFVSTVDFDVVQIENTGMGLYLEALPHDIWQRAVWHLHDVDWIKYARIARLEPKPSRRLRLWLHSLMLRWWKPRYAERFGRCTTVSEADRRLLVNANPRLQVGVVPSGIDVRAYQPLPYDENKRALIFVGNMGYRPNVDAMVFFCGEILPLIRREVPDVKMWIVGINPMPAVKRLDGNGVHVTGRVDDVRPYYRRSTVCVLPLRGGGGASMKMLEAMALGRPIVSTTMACEGRDVVEGEHLLVADSPAQFAEKTIRLLTDEALRQRVTAKARKLVVTRYDWDAIAGKLMRIHSELAR